MDHQQAYSEVSDRRERTYYTTYVRNSRAVGVMWGIFTICFAIINVIVFIQPQWIGDNQKTSRNLYFGLYEYCHTDGEPCTGRFIQFNLILSVEFKAATIFIGISAILGLLCVCCLLLFFFAKVSVAYIICGVIQILSGLCMFLGCVIYPAGWNHSKVTGACESGVYDIGTCSIRWAYILAIIGIFDVLILAMLAFILAARQPRKEHIVYSKSEINGYPTEQSIAIQPVLAVPEPGPEYSEYSHASAKPSRGKADFPL